MSDLIRREEDGWIELEEVHAHPLMNMHKIWLAVGAGDINKAMVEIGGFYDFEDDELIDAVDIISTPDDIIGSLYRIWVKFRKLEP